MGGLALCPGWDLDKALHTAQQTGEQGLLLTSGCTARQAEHSTQALARTTHCSCICIKLVQCTLTARGAAYRPLLTCW